MTTVKTTLDEQLNQILDRFPSHTTFWSQATDEIRDLAHDVRTIYNEMVLNVIEGDEAYIEAINWRAIKTPSEWNRLYKDQILKLWPELNPADQEFLIREFI